MSHAAFFEAAQSGDADALATHLDAEPERLYACGAHGWTALHLAAYFGHDEAVRLLLARGASVTAVSENEMANTPLHAALAGERHPGIVERLLEANADVNAVAASGVTPLHLAAARGDTALCRRFLALGADPAARTDDGQTPADIATARDHPDTAALLRDA